MEELHLKAKVGAHGASGAAAHPGTTERGTTDLDQESLWYVMVHGMATLLSPTDAKVRTLLSISVACETIYGLKAAAI